MKDAFLGCQSARALIAAHGKPQETRQDGQMAEREAPGLSTSSFLPYSPTGSRRSYALDLILVPTCSLFLPFSALPSESIYAHGRQLDQLVRQQLQ